MSGPHGAPRDLPFRPYPTRRMARAVILRSVVIWLALRAAVAIVSALISPSTWLGDGIALDGRAALVVIAMSVALVGLDARRLNEHLFLANLGVPFTAILATGAFAPTVLEVAAAMLLPG